MANSCHGVKEHPLFSGCTKLEDFRRLKSRSETIVEVSKTCFSGERPLRKILSGEQSSSFKTAPSV